jgi:hypothetical protein
VKPVTLRTFGLGIAGVALRRSTGACCARKQVLCVEHAVGRSFMTCMHDVFLLWLVASQSVKKIRDRPIANVGTKLIQQAASSGLLLTLS